MLKTATRKTPPRKDTKMQLRLQPAQKSLIARAAEIRKTTVSGFMLENACAAAEQVLADRVEFVLPPKQWAEFCKALDAPPRKLPALRRLLTEPSIFEVGHHGRSK